MSDSAAVTSIPSSWKALRWCETGDEGRNLFFGVIEAGEAVDYRLYQDIGTGGATGNQDPRGLVFGEPISGVALLFFMKVIVVDIIG
jgi:hypothetical protein